jgi:hypothetical protein
VAMASEEHRVAVVADGVLAHVGATLARTTT